jgi:hypothetical protein
MLVLMYPSADTTSKKVSSDMYVKNLILEAQIGYSNALLL